MKKKQNRPIFMAAGASSKKIIQENWGAFRGIQIMEPVADK